MKLFLLLFLIGYLSLTGCSSVEVDRVGAKKYASKPGNCPIKVMKTFPPDNSYEILGSINVKAPKGMWAQDKAEMLPPMKKAACELGADALVIVMLKESNPFGGAYQYRGKMTGSAIKLKSKSN